MATASKPALSKNGLLEIALKAVPAQLRPKRFTPATPEPRFDPEAYLAATLWICDRTRPLVTAPDQPLFAKWTELARGQLASGSADLSRRLSTPAGQVKGRALNIASRAVQQAASWRGNFNNNGWARAAARVHAELVVERGLDVTSYLTELNAHCLDQEARAMLRHYRLVPGAAVGRLAWRGVTAGKPTHWLVTLADRRLALLHKVATRWRLTEGAREFVLAHLPDHHLAAAAAATDC